MAPLLEQDYLIALREFCTYYIKTISKPTIRQLTSLSCLNNAKTFILKEHNEFTIENFLFITHWLFSYALKFDIVASQIHLDKENNKIMQFLQKIIENNFTVNNQKFTNDQLKDLKIINSDILSAFGSSHNAYLDFLFSQHQSRNDNNEVSPDIEVENLERKFDEFIKSNQEAKKLVYNVNKYLRFKNHQALFEIHSSKKTTPHSLFFCRFPEPFFNKDQDFIEKYNSIIEKTQSDIICLIRESLLYKIDAINTEINTFKNSNRNDDNDNNLLDLNEFVSYVMKKEENALKNNFIAMKNRAQRCVVKKFEVKPSRSNRVSHNNMNNNSIIELSENSENYSLNNSNFSTNTNNRSISWGHNTHNNYYDGDSRHRESSRRRDNSHSRDPSRHRDSSRYRDDSRHRENFRRSNSSRHRDSSNQRGSSYRHEASNYSRNRYKTNHENQTQNFGSSSSYRNNFNRQDNSSHRNSNHHDDSRSKNNRSILSRYNHSSGRR